MTYGERLKEINMYNLLSNDCRGKGGREMLTVYVHLKAEINKDRKKLFKVVLVYSQV